MRDTAAWAFRARGAPDRQYEGGRLALMIAVATLPAAVVGLFFKEEVERLFVSPRVVGFGLILSGTLLWWTRRGRGKTQRGQEISLLVASLVGLAQAVAIIPGISRSGSTIAMGLFCRLEQRFAARFSFLISIPAIFGSVVLERKELLYLGGSRLFPLVIGVAASTLTGVLAIKWLLMVVNRGGLYLFSYYCWILGLITLLLL